jgi:protein ImuA
MITSRNDIIARLQKELLPLQGFRPQWQHNKIDIDLGPINLSFPGKIFPLGAVHEFISSSMQEAASTCGFIAGILSTLMRKNGICLWISSSRLIFPPALSSFGIDPDKIIFIDLMKEKDVLWTMEEALKCEGLAGVIGEIKDLDFTTSRRLQLAVETSRVTGFVLRKNITSFSTTACVSRWKINSLHSSLPGNMPGVGFPAWNVSLLKIRNGIPGSWQLEWKAGRFHLIVPEVYHEQVYHKQTG